jgi:serine/threonine protein phosphatase PrpC
METIIPPRVAAAQALRAPVELRRPRQTACAGAAGTLAFAGLTHIGGRHLEHGGVNEDSIAMTLDDERLHAVIADGVSMGAHGCVASAACANHLVDLRLRYPEGQDEDDDRESLRAGILAADAAVAAAVARLGQEKGATTFSGLWFSLAGQGWLSRCGDCRTWLFWRGADGRVELHQLGEDQTFAATGEAPRADGVPAGNPSRMVGLGKEYVGAPAVWDVTLAPGGGVLLTSDGLHGALPAAELRECLEASLARALPPEHIVRDMMARAQAGGGSGDDASVFLLYRPMRAPLGSGS